MKKRLILILSLICVMTLTILCSTASAVAPKQEIKSTDFASVPMEYRPWCYYWCLKGNFTKEKFTKDLEAMKAAGFAGVLFFDSRGYHEDPERHIPVPLEVKYEFMSSKWQEMVTHLIKEADRLDMKVSLNLSNTGGHLRGPWDFRDEGPREIVWTEGNVNGPKKFTAPMTTPKTNSHVNENAPYYKDIALLAVKIRTEPTPGREEVKLNESWGSAIEPNAKSPLVEKVIDISDKVQKGTLRWDVPAGAWKIIRFGSQVIGDYGSVDILNKDIITKYFHRIGTKMLDNAGSSAGKALSHFYNVSWEGSNPNWTDGFDDFFQEKRGYPIKNYLPVLRGLNVGSVVESQRFLCDFYRTISDSFCVNCYQQIGKLSHERGILWHSEDGGPWQRNAPMFKESDMLTFWGQNDFPQGEFWVREAKQYTTRSNMKYAANAAHIYGQNIASVEAFTHMIKHWTIYPDILKVAADSNFIDGANMFIWHTFSCCPEEVGKPGYEYFAGTHVNSSVTWFDKVGGITSYLARCQYLLRKGWYGADFCVYVSDKNYVGWGRGEKWNPASKLLPPTGFAYDLLDTNVLVNRLKFENGRLVLPDGMSYKYLVLDPIEKELSIAALEKIVSLVEQGAVLILGATRPQFERGLKNYPNCDLQIVALANKLWGNGTQKVRSFGKGKIYCQTTIPEFLAAEKALPDFTGPFEYHHRKTTGADIYFLAGKGGSAECTFRVAGKTPEFWDPMTGKISPAPVHSFTQDGRTKVQIDLPKDGSVFVVFRSKAQQARIDSIKGPEAGLFFTAQKDGDLSYLCRKSGKYYLTCADGKRSQELVTECLDPITLTGPWNVSFDPVWGGPKQVVFDKLVYWNDRPEPGIKFYSGTAVYTKTFDLPATNNTMELSLGKVEVISRVRLNGKELGLVWTDPWTIPLGNAAKVGKNELSIEVTNCWANRLIGDAGLPPEKRYTKTNIHLYNIKDGVKRPFQGFANTDPLRNSGLIGPVQIRFGVTGKISIR